MTGVALEVERLSKRFGDRVAVADISFRIARGEAVGLLGPNGAGKTTTVSMISGLIRPDAGRVVIAGQDLGGRTDPIKRKLGLVTQELAIIEELSARANLRFFGELQDLDPRTLAAAVSRCLSLFGLSDCADMPSRRLSGGMKRRLNLAVALLHDPDLIVLDEPTVGIDPQSRNAIFDGLEALRGMGKSILYTTHYMEEAERLCDRMVIIDHGRVIADDTLRGLAGLVPSRNRLTLELDAVGDGPWLASVRAVAGVGSVARAEDRLTLDVDSMAVVPRVLDDLADSGVAIRRIGSERFDLQAIFLELTGGRPRDP